MDWAGNLNISLGPKAGRLFPEKGSVERDAPQRQLKPCEALRAPSWDVDPALWLGQLNLAIARHLWEPCHGPKSKPVVSRCIGRLQVKENFGLVGLVCFTSKWSKWHVKRWTGRGTTAEDSDDCHSP